MKKIMVLCIVIATALVYGSFLYAAKATRVNVAGRQIKNEDVVKSSQQLELLPSLFFF